MSCEAKETQIRGMTATERYLFDLNGYLIVPGVLSQSEVREINEVIDRALPSWDLEARAGFIHTGYDEETTLKGNSDPAGGPVYFYGGLVLDWGAPIRRLVGHQKILSHLIELIGPRLRLDHQYAILMKPHDRAGVSHDLHGGGTPYDHSQCYEFRNGRFYNGLTVASFALTDTPAGAGGFCCIPGSHKSNLDLPEEMADLTRPADCVVQPALHGGDVLIFTEALTHGCLKWKAEHERRALLFKYCPGHLQWEKGSPFTSKNYEWDEHQRLLLTPPYLGDRPRF